MMHDFVQESLRRLEIESKPSNGTSIRMLFLAADIQAQAPRQPSRDQVHLEPRGQVETILVVEDSNDVLELAREHLTTLGHDVLTARDADEALTVFDKAEGRIDLLFTDLVIPGSMMSGLALADAVRERSPGIGVLLTTGCNDDLLTEGKVSAGADVIGKPYRRSELADRVRAVLNGRGHVRRMHQAALIAGTTARGLISHVSPFPAGSGLYPARVKTRIGPSLTNYSYNIDAISREISGLLSLPRHKIAASGDTSAFLTQPIPKDDLPTPGRKWADRKSARNCLNREEAASIRGFACRSKSVVDLRRSANSRRLP